MNQLRCCEGCSRHVLISERACPFCERELTPLAERVLPNLPAGLSRAQRLAIAAAMAGQAALTACAETTDGSAMPHYGAPLAGNSASGSPAGSGGGSGRGVAVPVYGAPVAGHAGSGVIIAPPYGLPIAGWSSPTKDAGPPDAAPPDQDGDTLDASPPRDAGNMVHPLYGAPVPIYGAPIPPKR